MIIFAENYHPIHSTLHVSIMTRVIVCTVFLAMAAASSAQVAVVNDVKKSINQLKTSAADYTNAINKLKPALEHEQTGTRAQTWLVNAKAHLGLYERLGDAARVGKKVNVSQMEHALVDGCFSLERCLSLDTTWLTDKNGQPALNSKTGLPRFKTKHSAEALRLLTGNLPRLYSAGNRLFNLGDWQGACDAWQIYSRHTGAGDTLMPSIRYYQAIARWHQQDYAAAAALFEQARRLGYNNPDAFDYAMACLEATADSTAIITLAHEAFETLGTTRPRYLRIIINDCIRRGDFDRANRLLDTALATDSTNVELLNAKGIILERQMGSDSALPYFTRAINADPDNHLALFNMGRYYYNRATELRLHDSQASRDLYQQAMPLLERAYEQNPDSPTVRNALRDIYYRLGLASRLTDIEQPRR